ncbi:MAG: STAS domain-containing protein [Thermodesulfobacteriota bacterium]
MAGDKANRLSEIITRYEKDLIEDWMHEQLDPSNWRKDLISENDLRRESAEFMALFTRGARSGNFMDLSTPEWEGARDFLAGLSRSRAVQGFSPSETATFVFSLKQPLFTRLQQELGAETAALAEAMWPATVLLDKLGLFTIETFIQGREEIIKRQQMEVFELSTPVVRMWEGILVLPLIGTLDSARTQGVMENLLQSIVDTGSQIAIIDITGVPAVDTLVAQHLLKTMTAAKLMGAQCIISGIRPQIAQTMVHLGVAFGDVVTKATLSDALAVAFKILGFAVVRK